MDKIKFEKIKRWFTPLQAANYMFDDINGVSEQELYEEMANLVNEFSLQAHIRNFDLKPISEDGDRYSKLLQYYNQYSDLLPIHPLVDSGCMSGSKGRSKAAFSIYDIHDFSERYENDPELDIEDLFFPFNNKPTENTTIIFTATATKYELGFTRESLDDFITLRLGNQTKLSSNETKKSLHPRTKNNYLRLIMELANNIEGFDVRKPYVAAELIIDNTDTDISRETIAGYIQEAHELESKTRE